MKQVTAGEPVLMELDAESAARVQGPATMDGIGPASEWREYWVSVDAKRRNGAPWRPDNS
jgi:phthalate 4,5-dioxygenase oxygenase subunit